MPTLSEYSNVYNSALLVAKNKGYDVWYNSETNFYCAQKGGWDFWAKSPCGLLGLIAMFEHLSPTEYKSYWWQVEGPDIYDDMPTAPQPFTSVMEKK
jgi:hypothetical protein